MREPTRFLTLALVGGAMLAGSVLDAWAGIAAVGVPGPLAGVGLPALALGAGVYWVIKKLRGTDDDEQV